METRARSPLIVYAHAFWGLMYPPPSNGPPVPCRVLERFQTEVLDTAIAWL